MTSFFEGFDTWSDDTAPADDWASESYVEIEYDATIDASPLVGADAASVPTFEDANGPLLADESFTPQGWQAQETSSTYAVVSEQFMFEQLTEEAVDQSQLAIGAQLDDLSYDGLPYDDLSADAPMSHMQKPLGVSSVPTAGRRPLRTHFVRDNDEPESHRSQSHEPRPLRSFAMSRTDALMAAVRRSPVFRQLIPQEAVTGWPLPNRRDDSTYVTLPFHRMSRRGGETGQWDLYPPFATLSFDWGDGRLVAYRDLAYDRPWEPPEGPVGTFPHSSETASKRRYLERRAELLVAYDELFQKLATADTFENAWITRFGALLGELMEPSLKPFYRALAPKFVDRFLST